MVYQEAIGVSQARRSRRRLTVHYGAGSATHIGYSGNVSRTGMMIRTTRVFEPGTVLTLQVEHLTQTLHLKGRVMWARVGELRWLPTGKIGMGIRFIDPPANLMEILFPIAPLG
ncbi:MAG: PilZ domain-containing protein [Acidobacteria bacterium]|nr:PilZ domain-containing protein [Acidobacteriota bacterium]